MKLRAENVLNDLRRAIELHKDSLQSEEFRISWFSIVCLLRAVGHVLDKIDSKLSPELKAIIDRKYKELKSSKPKPDIFWEFIEVERNRFLKEFEHSIDRGIPDTDTTSKRPWEADHVPRIYATIECHYD